MLPHVVEFVDVENQIADDTLKRQPHARLREAARDLDQDSRTRGKALVVHHSPCVDRSVAEPPIRLRASRSRVFTCTKLYSSARL